VALTAVAAGATCTNGGNRIDSGLDNGTAGGTARNGTLEAGEVTSVQYVCNGGGAAGLTGAILKDNNGVSLGRIVTASRSSATIVTSTGHMTILNWNGTFPVAQVYFTSFSAGVCGGSAYLNSGSSATSPTQYMYGKNLVWVGSMNSLMTATAASIQADGTAATVTPGGSGFTIAGIDNPACGTSSSTQHMWPLVSITRASSGLPATIVAPLTIN
jgi:hypothetical protein